ncbi:MAG: polysaccharide deacetylase family protein [Lachnospiraceae bacterium]|nr:polysaccharide deacetylase family protein [Lachnospiraceae bacterium]
MAVIALAVTLIAGSLGMATGGIGPADADECITSVMNEEEAVDSLKIAITFDDGPHPYYTEQLLDGLKERGAKASFFVMGKQAEAYPELVLRMHEEGHLVGNHTYSHVQLGENNRETFKAELVRTNELLSGITGEEPQYVRPPYGSWDKSFETELMMIPVLWTIDPMDWCSSDVSGIVRKVTKNAEENAVILLHDEYKSTVTAALEIVDILQKQGYEFVTVDEIMFD